MVIGEVVGSSASGPMPPVTSHPPQKMGVSAPGENQESCGLESLSHLQFRASILGGQGAECRGQARGPLLLPGRLGSPIFSLQKQSPREGDLENPLRSSANGFLWVVFLPSKTGAYHKGTNLF